MNTDKLLTFAENEGLPGGGVGSALGALGGTSITGVASEPFILDMAAGNGATQFEFIHDFLGSSSNLELAIDIKTPLSTTTPSTLANGLVEFSLVSLPWNPLNLTNAATRGKVITQPITGIAASNAIQVATAFHDMPVGTPIWFSSLTGGTGLTANTAYYVVGGAINQFRLASTSKAALEAHYDPTSTVVTFSTDITAGTMVAMPYVHATTGFVNASQMHAGQRITARLNPSLGYGPSGIVVPHYPGGVSLPLGSQSPASTGLGGGGGGKGAPTPGRYVCLMVRVLQTTVATGTYSAYLVQTSQNNQAHTPTRFRVS